MVRELVITKILSESDKITLALVKECNADNRFVCKIYKSLIAEPKFGMKLKGVLKFTTVKHRSENGGISDLQNIEVIPTFSYEKCWLKIKKILGRSERYQYLLVSNRKSGNEFVVKMPIDEADGLEEGYTVNCEMSFNVARVNKPNGELGYYQNILAKRLLKNNEEENEEDETNTTND